LSAKNNAMRNLLLILILFISVSSKASQEITKEALYGTWLIVQVGDLKTADLNIGKDIWKFKNDKFVVTSNGKEIGSPEPFVVKNGTIEYGKAPYTVNINIIEFSVNKMIVDVGGITQVLRKIAGLEIK